MNRSGFSIFIDTVFQGPVPSVIESLPTDPAGAPGRICVFATEREAQREIVENMIVRLQEFLDGERDFGDAVTLEEYVVPVDVLPDGSIVDADGNAFTSEEHA